VRALLCAMVVVALAAPVFAQPLTKAELFALYVQEVGADRIATRLNQLYTALPAGATKTQARTLLKGDLTSALDAKRAGFQALRDRFEANVTAVDSVDLD